MTNITNEKVVFGSLALDLKRVAIGNNRGSYKMADRFMQEALKRIAEARTLKYKPYIGLHLDRIVQLEKEKDMDKKADYALTYSIVIQNYCLKYC